MAEPRFHGLVLLSPGLVGVVVAPLHRPQRVAVRGHRPEGAVMMPGRVDQKVAPDLAKSRVATEWVSSPPAAGH